MEQQKCWNKNSIKVLSDAPWALVILDCVMNFFIFY